MVTRYTSYTHMDRSLTRCPCWPASTANQIGLVTLTFDLFDLESGVRVTCVTLATSVPILVFLGLSVLGLGPMYASDRRQTDNRQTDVRRASSLNASVLWGRGIIIITIICVYYDMTIARQYSMSKNEKNYNRTQFNKPAHNSTQQHQQQQQRRYR